VPSAAAPSPPTPPLDNAGDRATGMASASPSPAASPSADDGDADDRYADDRYADDGDADEEFAHAEAEAERQAAREEARKAKDALSDAPSLDLRLGRGSVDLTTASKPAAAATWNVGYDDLGEDPEESESAYEAVEAALKAVTGGRPEKAAATPHGGLFAKQSHLSASSGSLSSSFTAIRLSEAMGSMPHDEFLDRLQRAEARPISPGGMRHAGLQPPKPSVLGPGVTMPESALFHRGVAAS